MPATPTISTAKEMTVATINVTRKIGIIVAKHTLQHNPDFEQL